MRFTEKENSFELTVIGYQYPNAMTEPYDSNWLVVQVNASTFQGTWGVTHPCLLTYEVRRLAEWFDKIASGNFAKMECNFIEPLLSFSVLDNDQRKLLRINFGLEALPTWAEDQDEYFIEFALSELDLESASDALREQLDTYPQRAAK